MRDDFEKIEIDFNGLEFETDPKITLTKDEMTKKIDDNWKGIARKINKHLTKNYIREKKTPMTDCHLSNDEKAEIDLILKKRKNLQDAEELRNNENNKTDDLTRKKKPCSPFSCGETLTKPKKLKKYTEKHTSIWLTGTWYGRKESSSGLK